MLDQRVHGQSSVSWVGLDVVEPTCMTLGSLQVSRGRHVHEERGRAGVERGGRNGRGDPEDGSVRDLCRGQCLVEEEIEFGTDPAEGGRNVIVIVLACKQESSGGGAARHGKAGLIRESTEGSHSVCVGSCSACGRRRRR